MKSGMPPYYRSLLRNGSEKCDFEVPLSFGVRKLRDVRHGSKIRCLQVLLRRFDKRLISGSNADVADMAISINSNFQLDDGVDIRPFLILAIPNALDRLAVYYRRRQ